MLYKDNEGGRQLHYDPNVKFRRIHSRILLSGINRRLLSKFSRTLLRTFYEYLLYF